jgi:ABC-type transport system involved in resistance to organic solvents, ATPase component
MDVEANVGFYLSQHRDRVLNRWLNKQEKADRVSSSLEVVGLPGVQKKMPSELSGGMRKRAALARLIAYRPKILLYDEPTTGLDPITAMQINLLINQVQKDLNATSIVVTHDIRSAIEIGDRLAFHDEGIIQVVAPKDEFINLKNPQVHAFFENAVLSNHIFTGKES